MSERIQCERGFPSERTHNDIWDLRRSVGIAVTFFHEEAATHANDHAEDLTMPVRMDFESVRGGKNINLSRFKCSITVNIVFKWITN